MEPLSDTQIETYLSKMVGWEVVNQKLHKEFFFTDFNQAFAFMSRVAELAETQQHHPEWFNVYNRVVIDLATHEAGGITQKDIDLAQGIDHLA